MNLSTCSAFDEDSPWFEILSTINDMQRTLSYLLWYAWRIYQWNLL